MRGREREGGDRMPMPLAFVFDQDRKCRIEKRGMDANGDGRSGERCHWHWYRYFLKIYSYFGSTHGISRVIREGMGK
jgi:hypothetical protein